jgi:hypothetical protein
LIPGTKAKILGKEVKINSAGFRDTEYELNKPEDIFRIIVLGDSFTFGHGVSDDETYPNQLEILLNQPTQSVKYEVLNFAVDDYNAQQEFALLRTKGFAYNPDMIVIGFYYNDIEVKNLNPDQTKNGELKDVKQKNRLSWYFNYLRQSSYFIKFLSPRINALLRMMGVKSFGTSGRLNDFLSKENIPGWRECQKILLEIKKETQQRDIKLVIVLLVDALRLDKNYPFRQTHKVVKDFLQNNGIPVVDLLDKLDGKDLSGYRVSLLDAHPNPEVHKLYAEEIFKSLIENNLLN